MLRFEQPPPFCRRWDRLLPDPQQLLRPERRRLLRQKAVPSATMAGNVSRLTPCHPLPRLARTQEGQNHRISRQGSSPDAGAMLRNPCCRIFTERPICRNASPPIRLRLHRRPRDRLARGDRGDASRHGGAAKNLEKSLFPAREILNLPQPSQAPPCSPHSGHYDRDHGGS
ncbi:unannotated protein [freshwater metagenome]|uniref:Unannotated protein n=1 Tax=freshwater metagenome TaxID=449393 RepID=A0A6J6GLU4_9ZZZZ